MANEIIPQSIQSFNASNRLPKTVTFGPSTDSGTSSATGATSLTDAAGSMVAHAHIGETCYSNGSSGVITENTATVITVTSWTGGTPTAVKPYMVAAAGVNGPIGAVTLGTISASGIVIVRALVAVGTTTLTAVGTAGVMTFGVTGNAPLFYADGGSGHGPAELTAGKFWNSQSTPPSGGLTLPSTAKDTVINANVLLTITGENILTGALSAIIYWDPISSGATLT